MSRIESRKERNRGFRGGHFVALATIIAFASVFTIAAVQPASFDDGGSTPYAKEPPLAGSPVLGTSDADALIGYSIQTPQSLAPGISLQGIRVVKEVNLVYLIYGSRDLPPEPLYFSDLLSSGYWIFIQSPESISPEQQGALVSQMVSDSRGSTVAIEVSGNAGFISMGDINNHLVWWANGTHCELVTPLGTGSSAMIAFANSVSLPSLP